MTLFLGGGSLENPNQCLVVSNKSVNKVIPLESSQEEADDRMMMHVNYEVMKGASKIIVASSDTDVLICLLYHLVTWRKQGLSCLWNVRGPSHDKKVIPLHLLLQDVGENVALQLPALHSLTGCDTVSKVSTKIAALKQIPCEYISNFGKQECTEETIENAENFLVSCIKPVSSKITTFDELRNLKYFDFKSQLDLTKLPCTSSSIRLHILRAYYQCRLWIEAPFHDISASLPPTSYGYRKNGDFLEPVLVEQPVKPSNLPDPCNCQKCARETVCPCRIVGISCCKYCKCKNGPVCKNPYLTV